MNDDSLITHRIYVAYWSNPHIKSHISEFRINMWRLAMGLNDTVDIEMGLINKKEFK